MDIYIGCGCPMRINEVRDEKLKTPLKVNGNRSPGHIWNGYVYVGASITTGPWVWLIFCSMHGLKIDSNRNSCKKKAGNFEQHKK